MSKTNQATDDTQKAPTRTLSEQHAQHGTATSPIISDTNQASKLKRQLTIILDAHEMLMIEQNGRPDCKNCVLAETIQELIGKEIEL